MNCFGLPFFTRLKRAKRILVAGAGGGFDVFSGLPLYFNLRASGKQVFLANLSFSNLPPGSAGRQVGAPPRRAPPGQAVADVSRATLSAGRP